MNIENLSTLKIHKLTQEQYDRELAAGRIDENALYLTPDEASSVDNTLTIAGAAADAKAVGDALGNKMDSTNPTGTGAFSLNRKSDTTIGDYSFAEGQRTTASGHGAHAEGYNTTASGDNSHAEGAGTVASGSPSHAEGSNTTASGNCSHAEGEGTIATTYNSHVQGQYNIKDESNKYAHIVGNGDDDTNRSNAHTIDWDGLGWFAGGLKVGGTGQDDANAKEVATKEYVDNAATAVKNDTLKELNDLIDDYNADVANAFELIVTNKANASDLTSHTSNTSNPHGVTAAQVGARPNTWTPSASDVGAEPAFTTLPIAKGGTGATDRINASKNINYIGMNPITGTANDTVPNWVAQGSGFAYYNQTTLRNQPTQRGFLVNKVCDSTVHQEWHTCEATSKVYVRAGQGESWWGGNDTNKWTLAGTGLTATDVGAMPSTGGLFNNWAYRIEKSDSAGRNVSARDRAIIRTTAGSATQFCCSVSTKTANGTWDMGTYGDSFVLNYATDANFNAGTNTITQGLRITETGALVVGAGSFGSTLPTSGVNGQIFFKI